MSKLYFVYDPEGEGYNEFKIKQDAEKFATNCIGEYLEEERIEDAVEQVTMGEVFTKAGKTDILKDLMTKNLMKMDWTKMVKIGLKIGDINAIIRCFILNSRHPTPELSRPPTGN